MANPDELDAIARAQISNFLAVDSDFDFAFRLQLEEALTASLLPPSSPPQTSSKVIEDEEFDFFDARSEDESSEIEVKLVRNDNLCDFFRDLKVTSEIRNLDGERLERERPFGEGCSSSSPPETGPKFRLYFKGMVNVEMIQGSEVTMIGIGVAICDPRGQVIFQLSMPLVGSAKGRQVAEIKALIEGLERALALDLKHITFCCHRRPVYLYARQIWQPKGAKVAKLMENVEQLQKKFDYCRPSLVTRSESKFAIRLAKSAIAQQKSRPIESNYVGNLKETCPICLEERDRIKIFTVDGCKHRYCFSCMKQHVEAKLSNRNRMAPRCPHENCKSELNVDSCEKFLTPKQMETMKEWIREISMPVAERVYCPYPKCSALMSKSMVSDFARKENVRERMFGARKCLKCHELFCYNCKVPWHKNMTCKEYKKLNPDPRPEDIKLKSLASSSLWRQCVKCNHMIELAEGCYHMTCRCGHEFCYNCGAEWRQKKPTCSCPLWVEDNILFDGSESDEEDDDDYEFDNEYDSDEDDDDIYYH